MDRYKPDWYASHQTIFPCMKKDDEGDWVHVVDVKKPGDPTWAVSKILDDIKTALRSPDITMDYTNWTHDLRKAYGEVAHIVGARECDCDGVVAGVAKLVRDRSKTAAIEHTDQLTMQLRAKDERIERLKERLRDKAEVYKNENRLANWLAEKLDDATEGHECQKKRADELQKKLDAAERAYDNEKKYAEELAAYSVGLCSMVHAKNPEAD